MVSLTLDDFFPIAEVVPLYFEVVSRLVLIFYTEISLPDLLLERDIPRANPDYDDIYFYRTGIMIDYLEAWEVLTPPIDCKSSFRGCLFTGMIELTAFAFFFILVGLLSPPTTTLKSGSNEVRLTPFVRVVSLHLLELSWLARDSCSGLPACYCCAAFTEFLIGMVLAYILGVIFPLVRLALFYAFWRRTDWTWPLLFISFWTMERD